MSTNTPTLFPLPPADAPTPPILPNGRWSLADDLFIAAQPEDVRAMFARVMDTGRQSTADAYERGYSAGYAAGEAAAKKRTAGVA